MEIHKRVTVLGLLWLALCSVHAATLSGYAIEEVIITSQKRTESLQDVPIAVSVFSGEDLTGFGISSVQSLQRVTPSLVYNNTGAQAQPYLRGVGTRLSFMGLESSVATYSDDRYISRAAATMFDLADIERVEVLKGPQGSLYGRNATGGAIRLISKDPAAELEGTVTATLGNYDYRGLSGTVSIPLADNLNSRFTALVRRRDGYADNLSPKGSSELDDKDIEAYRAKLILNIGDVSTLRLTLNYWSQEDNGGSDSVDLSPPGLNVGIAEGGISGTDIDRVATAIDEVFDQEELAVQMRLDVLFDDFDFASITTYSNWDTFNNVDGDGTSARTLDLFGVEEAETYTQEFQLLSNTESSWEWLLGTYFFTQEGASNLFADSSDLGILPLRSLGGKQAVESRVWALFGQASYHFNDHWSLTLGARWNDEEKEVAVKAVPGMINVPAANLPFKDRDSWTEFTPKVTLERNMADGMAYLTYARGFKSGGYNYPAAGNQALDPEILDMIELGWKADLLETRLRANAALFYYDYEDLQVTRAARGAGGGGTITTENAANAKVKGLELDLTWLVTEQLTFTAGISALDSEYDDYDAIAQVFNASLGNAGAGMDNVSFPASGESLLRAPDLSAYLSVGYGFTAGDGKLPLIVTYSYKDDYDFDFVADPLSEPLTQDSYGLFSARVSYRPPRESWILSLWGNNLTDEKYFDDIVGNPQGLRGSYGAPRTYGVDITVNF